MIQLTKKQIEEFMAAPIESERMVYLFHRFGRELIEANRVNKVSEKVLACWEESERVLLEQIYDIDSIMQFYADEENYTKSGVLLKDLSTPEFGELASQYLEKYREQ